jgi:hypothetical protein
MGRVGQLRLSYGVILAEYLVVGGASVGTVLAKTAPPRTVPPGCMDACGARDPLVEIELVIGVALLTVAMVVALAMFARWARNRRQQQKSGFELVIAASGAGLLWGCLAILSLPSSVVTGVVVLRLMN